jgi:hypothetical protein
MNVAQTDWASAKAKGGCYQLEELLFMLSGWASAADILLRL